MCDNDIIDFFNKFDKKFRWDRLRYKYTDIYNYLINKYNDSSSPKESYIRIINDLDIRPTCCICGNHVDFLQRAGKFKNTCSNECANILRYESIKSFNIQHYGVENYYASDKFKIKLKEKNLQKYNVNYTWQRNDVKEKIKKTCLKKYGVENGGGSKEAQEKIKQTTLEHFGVECSLSSPIIREKIKKTCLEKYGGNSPYSSMIVKNKAKENAIKKYGVDCWQKTDEGRKCLSEKLSSIEIQEKINNTKRKNHTFNTSKHEQYILKTLKKYFIDVKYQYKDINKYPYKCDFYIPNLDLFIEYNGTWTHGGHLFDENNINDLNILNKWKEKSINHKYYKTAIYVWTNLDKEKYNIAIKNKLNYLIFYNLNEFNNWIKIYEDNQYKFDIINKTL